MPEYQRPALIAANQSELAAHLLTKGLECSLRIDGGALIITIAGTNADLNAALADFANVGATWRLPLPGDLPAHVQHLIDFKAQVRAGTFGTGLTAAQRRDQTEHVIADLIGAFARLIDDRLG